MIYGARAPPTNLRLQQAEHLTEHFPPAAATMASHTEEHIYHPKDAVSGALRTTMYTGGVGLFASAVQNTLLKQNVGPWGVFVRSGNTIGIMGM